MPQLDGSVYITQIFWLLVTFISFWFIMAKCVVPKISETIEARKRKYDDYIRKAEEINAKALEALNRYDKMLAVAKTKATEQILQNENELKQIIAEKENEINQQLKIKVAEQEELLEKEKKSVLAKINTLSQETAYEILQKIDVMAISREDLENISKEEE